MPWPYRKIALDYFRGKDGQGRVVKEKWRDMPQVGGKLSNSLGERLKKYGKGYEKERGYEMRVQIRLLPLGHSRRCLRLCSGC